MNEIMKLFLSLSVSGGIAAIIILMLKPLLKNRLSKTWNYYIWLIVIMRLLVPFSTEINIVNQLFFRIGEFVAPMSDSSTNKNNTFDSANSVDSIVEIMTPQSIVPEYSEASPQNKGMVYWAALRDNAWILWLCVAAVLMSRKITSYRSFVRYIKAGLYEVSDHRLLDVYKTAYSVEGLKKPPRLYLNSLVVSPMLIGVFRPFVVLPSAEMGEKELHYIFTHELTHHRRLDILYKWLSQTAACLHWFNPLVYIVDREINRNCELSCDELIIEKLDKAGRRIYGDTLLASLEFNGSYGGAIASITLNEDAHLLKERLEAVMKFKKKTTAMTAFGMVLALLLVFTSAITGVYAKTGSVTAGSSTVLGTAGQKTESKELFRLSDYFDAARGYYSMPVFSINNDENVAISVNMTVKTGQLKFCVFLLDMDYRMDYTGVYDKSGDPVEPVYEFTGNNINKTETIALKAGRYAIILGGDGYLRNVSYDIRGVIDATSTKKNTNSDDVIPIADIDAFTLELIQTTGNWANIQPFLPYMTSENVEKIIAVARQWYEPSTSQYSKYTGNGKNAYSKEPLTREFVDDCALAVINQSANWLYVKPLFPYMTDEGIDQVVSVFLQRTGRYDLVSQTLPGYEVSVESNATATGMDSSGYIDFAHVSQMTKAEVDALALEYTKTTGEFGYVYNLRQFMSTEGIDAVVDAYLKKTGDYDSYGMIGAMLQFMSKDAAASVADKYFQEKESDEYDWIFKSYRNAATKNGDTVIDLKNGDSYNIAESGSFKVKNGQILTLNITSSIKGGTVDLFLFDPSGKEQRITIGSSKAVKKITLTEGTWEYNCSGIFKDGGSIRIVGTVSK